MRLPLAYRAYRALLDRYRASTSPVFRRLVERSVEATVKAGCRLTGKTFPETATGGWWWTWRWRFEVLAGWNEIESVVWCRRLIRPGMRVLDVGAHIGYYTSLFSRLVGKAGAVYAFEPHPENFAVLTRNAQGRNVRRFPLAVGGRSGHVTLHLSPGSSNHSLMPGYTESRGTLQVECAALDDRFAAGELPPVDFVKIDVEGGELAALDGMERLLAASPRAALLVELNPRALECGGATAEGLLACLRGLGFEPRIVLPDGGLEIAEGKDWSGFTDSVNLLCRRPTAAAGRTSD